MDHPFLTRIDAAGATLPIPDQDAAVREGEALHRAMRPSIGPDYLAHLRLMAGEGAHVLQLWDEGEVRTIAVWRTYLTTYCGRRFELDDLVTAEGQRSKGYGAAVIAALDAQARAACCDAFLLTSATWRTDAHRFYFRERFKIDAFLFSRAL